MKLQHAAHHRWRWAALAFAVVVLAVAAGREETVGSPALVDAKQPAVSDFNRSGEIAALSQNGTVSQAISAQVVVSAGPASSILPPALQGFFASGDAAYLRIDARSALAQCDSACFRTIAEQARKWVSTGTAEPARSLAQWLATSERAEAFGVCLQLLGQLEALRMGGGPVEQAPATTSITDMLSLGSFQFTQDSATTALAASKALPADALHALQQQMQRDPVLMKVAHEQLVSAQGAGQAASLVDILPRAQYWALINDAAVQANDKAFAALSTAAIQQTEDAWLNGILSLNGQSANTAVMGVIRQWALGQLSGERLEQVDRFLAQGQATPSQLGVVRMLLVDAEDAQGAAVIAARWGL